jgi:dihydrofolate synthase/folylpolyglutamate synthase
MNYSEALTYIKEKEKKGSVYGLEVIRELLSRLGNPEKGIPAVHIAGTNGKGSIMSYVETSLVEAGLNVGRYISPTIYDYRERWSHNMNWASEDDVAEVLTIVRKQVDDMEGNGAGSPTAFEIETAAAFLLFKKWNCDIMLIECGMGGRMDATNVIEENVINVLASISMDHMQVLGNSIENITREKLGIVRNGSVLISYPQICTAKNVIKKYADEEDVCLKEFDASLINIIDEGIDGSSFEYDHMIFKIPLAGRYQIYNAVTAYEVLKSIRDNFLDKESIFKLSAEVVRKAFAGTIWDGRFQIVKRNPLVIVDGAHNEDAWKKLADSLALYFKEKKQIFIIGVLADKEYLKMIDILKPQISRAYTIQSDSPRALSAGELAIEMQKKDIEAVALEKISDILDVVTESEETYVICGSLSMSGEVISLFTDKS